MKIEKYKLYNDTIELEYEDTKHTYRVAGQLIQSVTGIVGIVAKPALIYWAVNKAVEYLTLNWQPGQSYDEIEIGKKLEEAKKAHRTFTTDAGNIGTLVHAWISAYIKDNDASLPVNEQAKLACQAFLQWVSEHQVKFLETERKIYSKKYGYAGTLDFEAEVDGKLVIGDIKTSSGIYPEMLLQTAGYQQARQEEEGKTYDHRVIVRVGKALVDGKPDFEIKEFTDFDSDFKGFLGALLLSNRINQLKTEEKNV